MFEAKNGGWGNEAEPVVENFEDLWDVKDLGGSRRSERTKKRSKNKQLVRFGEDIAPVLSVYACGLRSYSELPRNVLR